MKMKRMMVFIMMIVATMMLFSACPWGIIPLSDEKNPVNVIYMRENLLLGTWKDIFSSEDISMYYTFYEDLTFQRDRLDPAIEVWEHGTGTYEYTDLTSTTFYDDSTLTIFYDDSSESSVVTYTIIEDILTLTTTLDRIYSIILIRSELPETFVDIVNYKIVEAPTEVRKAAIVEASFYIGMKYEWGARDFYYSGEGVDCSGLIVNIYLGAIEGTNYKLLFDDATVVDFLNEYTVSIQTPEIGDLIFMGENAITHVAIFSHSIGNKLYFIDAYSVTGLVGERFYLSSNPKIKSFGRLLLKYCIIFDRSDIIEE